MLLASRPPYVSRIVHLCHPSIGILYSYRPQRSCGQGNIFTPVCHSFCSQRGGSASVHAGMPHPPQSRHTPPLSPGSRQTPPGADTPRSRHPPGADIPPQHTVYERLVRILLECILVFYQLITMLFLYLQYKQLLTIARELPLN